MTTKAGPALADESARLRAVEELADDDVAALVHALDDESWRVRQAAVGRLIHHGGTKAVGAVLGAMRNGHRSLNVLNSTIQILALSGVDTLGPLQEFLAGPDADLRAYAALTLGEQYDARAASALIRAVGDPDANVRFHAIEALGRLRAGEAVDVLMAVAESRDFALAFPALEALAAIGNARIAYRLVPLLSDDLLRDGALEALGRLGDEEAVGPLAGLLNAASAPAPAIARALAGVRERYERSYRKGGFIVELTRQAIAPTGVRSLLDAIEDADSADLQPLTVVLGWLDGPEVERTLTRLLGRPAASAEVIQALVSKGSRATDLVARQLEAEDLETRQAAVIALGRMGDARAVPALVRTLDDEELTVGVAGALASIGDARAYAPLLRFLGHHDPGVRRAIVSALNSLGHADMAADLVRLLQDPSPLVRESAAHVAAYAGYRECADLLLALCGDAQENVRRAAFESLPSLEDARVPAVLAGALQDAGAGVRAAAARALGQLEGENAAALLRNALTDPDTWVRYYAVRSLGKLADHAAEEALMRLAREDGAMQVRVAAVESLGLVGSDTTVPFLAALAEEGNTDLARAATAALGKTGRPDALSYLLSMLSSPEAARRMNAVGALASTARGAAAAALRRTVDTDPDAQVARVAVDALGRLKVPEAVDALVELAADPVRRHDCVVVLARVDKSLVPQMAQGLLHHNPDVRRAVVEALARTKTPRLSELLAPALMDGAASVRGAALTALAHSSGDK